MRKVTADEAVKVIKSGDRVFIHSIAAAPHALIDSMIARAPELEEIEIVQIHTEGEAKYATPEFADTFRTHAMFVGANLRKAVAEGYADYIPVFLSEVPSLFRRRILPLNVAMVQVSPPDKHGYCSLGIAVDVSAAAAQTADFVIAQINPNMPRTHGDGLIHIKDIDYGVDVDVPIPEFGGSVLSPIEVTIGKHCAELIDDGATLQMGIGAIPDAVLNALSNHRNLGVHTEMFADGLL